MKYRNIRIVATGQWLNLLFTSASDEFSTPARSHVKDMAAALRVPARTLEAVDGNNDRRTGKLLDLPRTITVSEDLTR